MLCFAKGGDGRSLLSGPIRPTISIKKEKKNDPKEGTVELHMWVWGDFFPLFMQVNYIVYTTVHGSSFLVCITSFIIASTV